MGKSLRRIILIPAVLAILGLGLFWAFRFEIQYYRYRPLIDAAADRYQVPARLIAAVIWQETRFNGSCRGKAGEIGLMQIMPKSAGEWAKAERIMDFTPETLLDPGTNVLAGTWYLARAIRRWGNQSDPLPYALAEYNAGRSNALRWDRGTTLPPESFAEAIRFPTTRAYVKNILKSYRTFGKPWERW
ncbi:MAG: lytic transglycosylase domain-containing protein [bacterium]